MEAATNPNNTNTFPNSLPLHIYKSILLFIFPVYLFIDTLHQNIDCYCSLYQFAFFIIYEVSKNKRCASMYTLLWYFWIDKSDKNFRFTSWTISEFYAI